VSLPQFRILLLTVLLFAAVASMQRPSSAAQPTQQSPSFRAGVDVVSLTVTVTDRTNRYVTDLDLSEFSVFEDGAKQDVTFFSRRQQPVALSLLLDSSASMEEHLSTLQAAAALALPLAAQQPTFRSGARTVPSYVTVTDGSNRLITDLPRDAFEVLDNGRPQEITIFDNEVRPITVVVMLDTSISMTLRLDDLFAGAEQFLLRLLPHDRAMLGAFNDKLQFTSGFTNDRDDLIASLKDLQYGNATRLYDALYASLDQLQGADGRKVMLLFTDGADFGSRQGPGRALERARDEEVMIYGVGLETEFFNGQRRVRSKPDEILNRFARETGGGYFELKLDADLNASFTRIAQELRSQYLIGFSPAVLDGKVHTLEVRVKRPAHKARSRRSYVASAELTRSENFP